jgi:hypothetical protein
MKKLTLIAAIIIATSTFAQVPNYVPTNGLVGWWPFNGNANDESGNGNNGIPNGAGLIADRNSISNSAYNLPNLNDNISVTNSSSPYNGNNLTVSFWMQFPTQYNQSSIFMVRNGVLWSNGFSISIDQNNGAYGANNYQVNFLIGSTSCGFITNQIELGVWSNIVAVYNGSQMILYLNNIPKDTMNYSLNISSTDGNLLFSDWENPTTPAVTNRNIDDIAIWNRALTTCEIKDLYNSQLGSTNTTSSETQTALDTYTWPLNNQTYTQSGTYSDTLVNAAGCDSIVTLNLTLNYTGINENNSSLLVISPNPTTGSFSLHGLEQLGTITSLRIMDNNGKVVQVLDPKATQFACSTLKTGVYFLEVTGVKTNDIVKLVIQ